MLAEKNASAQVSHYQEHTTNSWRRIMDEL